MEIIKQRVFSNDKEMIVALNVVEDEGKKRVEVYPIIKLNKTTVGIVRYPIASEEISDKLFSRICRYLDEENPNNDGMIIDIGSDTININLDEGYDYPRLFSSKRISITANTPNRSYRYKYVEYTYNVYAPSHVGERYFEVYANTYYKNKAYVRSNEFADKEVDCIPFNNDYIDLIPDEETKDVVIEEIFLNKREIELYMDMEHSIGIFKEETPSGMQIRLCLSSIGSSRIVSRIGTFTPDSRIAPDIDPKEIPVFSKLCEYHVGNFTYAAIAIDFGKSRYAILRTCKSTVRKKNLKNVYVIFPHGTTASEIGIIPYVTETRNCNIYRYTTERISMSKYILKNEEILISDEDIASGFSIIDTDRDRIRATIHNIRL